MQIFKCHFMKGLARVLILLTLLHSGCRKSDEKPLNFTPIDLDIFSRDMKGFNLLGKFDVNFSNYGYTEEEFIIIRDLGFNFARIPLDYRTYTLAGNWDVFLEDEIAKIDKVIEWGKKYGVHVCLNLHRAPGYCVNPSVLPQNQNLDLWTNTTAQEAFVSHWAYFASRYRDVPWEELSFNLVNEPGEMDEAAYVNVMKKAITKIQSINPDRVIFVDGLNYSRTLIPSLQNERNIIQAIHVYDPMTLTHYKAEWVSGSDSWPLPVWPMTDISQYLFGPVKSEYHSSLVLEGTFKKDSIITINVQQVSIHSFLRIKLDDNEIYGKDFLCGPDPGEDWTRIIPTQWGYQNISGKDYSVTLPADGTSLTLTNTDGDWMTFNSLTIGSGAAKVVIIPANTSWGARQDTYLITADGRITYTDGTPVVSLGSITDVLEEAKSEGIPVMIQEFGVYNKTPHAVTSSYLTDVVSVFNKNHVGYAMWNLIGTMGIINSERSDVAYEPYRGKLLDRELATIMQSTGR
jgi:aryl-phospho-beta-D-glucosidase BglC (GH1 family)